MAKRNSSNQDFSNNADGFDLSGGTTARKLTVTGADVTLTGSGTNTFNFPSASDTLVGRDSTDTMTNKTITSPVISTGVSGTAISAGSEVTTGTDNTKIVTPKAIGDADLNTRLKSKIITSSRNMTSASGDVSYTGVGFTPTSIHCQAMILGTNNACTGFSDSAKANSCLIHYGSSLNYGSDSYLIWIDTTGSATMQQATIKSYDSNGFTLTWTKTNSPTGTLQLQFICYR